MFVFLYVVLLWLSSSVDGVLFLIWRLASMMSLMSLFVDLICVLDCFGFRLISFILELSLVSNSVSEGFILYW